MITHISQLNTQFERVIQSSNGVELILYTCIQDGFLDHQYRVQQESPSSGIAGIFHEIEILHNIESAITMFNSKVEAKLKKP